MCSIFSHAQDPSGEDSRPAVEPLEPVVNTIVVPGPVARAFAGFTDHTHLWWPLEQHGVYGAGSYVEFEENLILETADDGRTSIWGTLDDWQPPLSFHATWHPGTTALWSTELLVVFRAVGNLARRTRRAGTARALCRARRADGRARQLRPAPARRL